MMIRSFFTVLMVLAASCLPGNSYLTAQQRSGTLRQPTLAVQVVDERRKINPLPVYWPPSEGGLIEIGTPKPLTDWKRIADGPPLTGIRINALMEGDAVRVKVTAIFDDSEPVDAPEPKYGRTEKPIGSYLVREGEIVNAELRAFGVEPLVLAIVKAVPRVEEPRIDFTPPEVVNNLKAVEVVTFVPETALVNSYRLTVRNVSNKGIIVFYVTQPRVGGRSWTISTSSDPARPVMRPGATHQVMVNENPGGVRTDQGFVAERSAHKFIISTVVFDDETYEGGTEEAVTFVATRTGRRIQIGRIVALLQKTLEAPDQDPAAMLEHIRTEVSGLRIDVDTQLVDDLFARFPELQKDYNKRDLSYSLMQGFKEGRQDVLSRIRNMNVAGSRDGASFNSVWQRMNSLREQLENEIKPVSQPAGPSVGRG